MKFLLIGVLVICSISSSLTEEVRLSELEPDEAAKLINQQDQSLHYAPKIQSNVPGVRFINDHPENVVEDIYLANQYHGQDGLGAYIYGYAIPDISKTEKKERSGDLKGSYNYIAGNGQEIKVEYWDDGTGFHQIDNVDRIQPKQVEDSPEVKAAKEEHLRLWHEQAERNSHAPADPNAHLYDQQSQQPQQPVQNQYQQYQGQSGQAYAGQVKSVQGYSPQLGSAQSSQGQYQPSNLNNVEYNGQYSNNQQTYAQQPGSNQKSGLKSNQEEENPEENGPPKGFFYNFDYPVGLIVGREGKNLELFYSENKNLYDKQIRGEGPKPSGLSSGFHASA